MFQSYKTTSEYFLSDYVAIAMANLRLVTTTWYFHTSKYRILTCENIWIFSVAEILIKHWCLHNNFNYYANCVDRGTAVAEHLKTHVKWPGILKFSLSSKTLKITRVHVDM